VECHIVAKKHLKGNPAKMTLKKIDHAFKNPELAYDSEPNYQPYIKLAFYFSKLPHVSYEQFHRHWETVHADLAVGTKDFALCCIQRYAQVFLSQATMYFWGRTRH
jgi:hypothetical protein